MARYKIPCGIILSSIYAVMTCTTHVAGKEPQGSGILSPPEVVIAFSGEEVSFTCTVCPERVVVFWILNDVDSVTLRDSPMQPRSEYLSVTSEGTTTQLRFIATPGRNHTVACKVVYGTDYLVDTSDTVTALIQGTLAAPTNLNATIKDNKKEITLNWTPPPSMMNIDQYSILYNDTMINGEAITYTHEYTLNVSRCENKVISLTVCASNHAGQGNFSTPITISNYCIQTTNNTDFKYFAISLLALVVVLTVLVLLFIIIIVRTPCCHHRTKHKVTAREEHRQEIVLKTFPK